MRAINYNQTGEINIIETPEPQIMDPNDVKVKTSYASICSYDILTIQGFAEQPYNYFIGHEASGIVIETGNNAAADFQPGDLVFVDFYSYCTYCSQCRKKNFSFCSNPKIVANGMSEYLVRNKRQIFKLPDNISLKEACLAEPVSMGLHALSKAKLTNGARVIILGGGSMGLIMLQLALLHPISYITVVDPHQNKRDLAIRLGANSVINPCTENLVARALDLTGGEGYDTVIEASGDIKSADIAIKMLARGGSLIYFSTYVKNEVEENLSLNLFTLYWKDASLHGVFYTACKAAEALSVIPRLNLESVITAVYPFEEAAQAFRAKMTGEHAKVMLKFDAEKI